MNASSDKRDFVRVVEDLEDRQRHDLSVQLYLAFLLHQVNPYFPHERWASWPVPLASVADPQEQNSYEDVAVDNLFRDYQDGSSWGTKSSGVASSLENSASSDQKIEFQRSSGKLELTHKRLRKSNPKATVVNEMYAALNRVIYTKAARLAKDGQKVTVKETEFTKKMALRLANKLDRTLSALKKQGRRKAFFSKTWQDVLIANIQLCGYGDVSDLESHKQAYLRAKELFMGNKYKYEYDPASYGDDGSSAEVPEFDIQHHLDTIDEEAKVKYPQKRPPLERLEVLNKESRMKDHIFWTLLRQKMTARQLSWRDSDIISDYEVPEGEFQQERQTIFTNKASALSPNLFKVNDA